MLGGGDDSVSMTTGTVKAATIGAGSGADTITITSAAAFQSSTFYGGGGADSVTLNDVLVGASNVVNLDSTANGGGADTLKLTTIAGANNTIKGKGGKDVLTFSAEIGTTARIEGNAGADKITLSAIVGNDALFVGGGSGNDTIALTAGISGTVVSATVQGGGGADSIFITAGLGAQSNYVFGGAGADTIDIGTVTTALGTVAYSDFSESVLGTNDVISAAAGSGISFSFSAATTTTLSAGRYVQGDTNITNGILVSGSAESLTARVEFLDTNLTAAGTVVAFAQDSKQYLFIQGGTSGTADDFVTQQSLTVSALTVTASQRVDLLE